jgi:gliding motility-associated transport system permease protein
MIFTIAAKELKTLFASPLAWGVLAVTQLIMGYWFLRLVEEFVDRQAQFVQLASPPGVTELIATQLFATTAGLFLFAIPILAMRLIAEERRNQTMVLLVSSPVSMTDIVLGKFLGIMAFLLIIIGLIALMPFSLAGSTRLDYGLLASLILGLTLVSACFAAISLFVSCLTAQPLLAALGGFAILLGTLLIGAVAEEGLRVRGVLVPASLVRVLAPMKNFEPFGKGVLDTYAIACLLLLAFMFLVLAIRQLDARRFKG